MKMTYSKKIRLRVRGLWVLLALMLVYMVVVGETGGGDSRMMTDLASLASRVIFFGGMAWVIYRIHFNNSLLKDRLRLEEKLIEEQDERRRYLHDKSGGWVMDAMLIFLLFATTTAALYSMAAFHMAIGALGVALALKAGAYWVLRRQSV